MRLDIAMVGDFRLRGGIVTAVVEEVALLAREGYRVGLAHVDSALSGRRSEPLREIRDLFAQGKAVRLDPADSAQASLLVVHNPRVLLTPGICAPSITAPRRVMVAHRGPVDGGGGAIFDWRTVSVVGARLFGGPLSWAPVSPVARANLAAAAVADAVEAEDWPNLLPAEDWAAPREGGPARHLRIGRHSRPELEKYPASREEMLAVYPDDPAVEVHLLGVDHRLRSLMGDFPGNWRTYPFGLMDPRRLLERIDFFVYFHHPDWVESFGRTIAEAMASGAVAVLPPYLEATFGPAAVYCAPGEAMDAVRRLHRDAAAMGRRIAAGREHVARLCGGPRYMAMIRALAGAPAAPVPPITLAAAGPQASPPAPLPAAIAGPCTSVDVVMVADFRDASDRSLRLAAEIGAQAEAGLATGLLHVDGAGASRLDHVAWPVDAAVGLGQARPLDPRRTLVAAAVAVVHGAHELFADVPAVMPKVSAGRLIAVADGPGLAAADLARVDRVLAAVFGRRAEWAPAGPPERSILERVGGLVVRAADWAIGVAAEAGRPKPRLHPTPYAGVLASGAAGEDEAIAALRRCAAVQPLILRLPGGGQARAGELDARVHATHRFLGHVEFLVHLDPDPLRLPRAAIATAACRGVICILAPAHREAVGAAAHYSEAGGLPGLLARLALDREALRAAAARGAAAADRAFGSINHILQIRSLCGPTPAQGPAVLRRIAPASRRVLFFASNGTGLGHVARLLAVARRCGRPLAPHFVSMSQGLKPIEQCGFPVEYVPSPIYAEVDSRTWNAWLERRMAQIFAALRPAAVIFDGSLPPEGLVRACWAGDRVGLAWMRRGMWRQGQDVCPIAEAQAVFDLVIEPRDAAGEADLGKTAAERRHVHEVDPIRLLDADELLPREAARGLLGLAGDRPAALVQLGSGNNRDLVDLTDRVVRALGRQDGLQVVLAPWMIGDVDLGLWPQARRLLGFPHALLLNAFDFVVSAAGYNSFNELIALGVPTIFLANESPDMDDQPGRASFADAQGAAFAIGRDGLAMLDRAVAAILDPAVRAVLRTNALRLCRPNGAAAAARLVEALAAPEWRVCRDG